jgi:multimeric flavodoxin WrbA
MPRAFLFLCSSGRPSGNSLRLAQVAASALPATDRQDWIDLAALSVPAFTDLRPAPPPPDPVLDGLRHAILAATDICLVAPVYWYALPAPAKLLLDHWSGWLDLPGGGFATGIRGRRLWLITARADPDPTVPEPLEAMVRRSALWLGMDWGGALHGIGDGAGEVLSDRAAMAAAERFFLPRTPLDEAGTIA